MSHEIWRQIGLFGATTVVMGALLAWGLSKARSDFQREFEQEQSDERSEKRRY